MDLSTYGTFFDLLRAAGFAEWVPFLERELAVRLHPDSHGDLPRWWRAVATLPQVDPQRKALTEPCVGAVCEPPVGNALTQSIRTGMMELHPWRKGPYCLHGVHLDCEWRSDWKWERLSAHIAPLEGRRVLDVGCGNGYHCWRMVGEGARLALGWDPTVLYVMQLLGVSRFLQESRVGVLPLALEDLPAGMTGFDTVFSLGVLYHRRSPIDHLQDLRRLLRPGGELVLETLVLDSDGNGLLVPPGRYARMRNVWFIPTPAVLTVWLERCGFLDVRVVDVTPTSVKEQRSTEWMRFHSLMDFLDPKDPGLTVEGHPAPRRGILVARA